MAPLLLAMMALAFSCRQASRTVDSTAGRKPAMHTELAWLDPQARISKAVRLTGPSGIEVRQAAYWQPETKGQALPMLAVLMRTRDYMKRSPGEPDAERISVLNLQTGQSARLDESMTGLPADLVVSADHHYACVSMLPALEAGGYSTDGLVLRGYGYGGASQEVVPRPAVLPVDVTDDGAISCRMTRSISIEAGLPAIVLDWSQPLQQCDVVAKSFAPMDTYAIRPNADAKFAAGYQIDYDPALPAQAAIHYMIESNNGNTQNSWELAYYVSPSPFEWRPPLAWIAKNAVATVAFRPAALGMAVDTPADLFRLVALEQGGGMHLLEDHLGADASLVAAGGGVVFYTRQASPDSWEVWACGVDGIRKQRIWLTNAVFVELLDIAEGRRLLLHRQFFGDESKPQLHSELLELGLDPLQPTTSAGDEIAPLSSPGGVIEEDQSGADNKPAGSSGSEPPADSGNGGDLFIPDNPNSPPPIS